MHGKPENNILTQIVKMNIYIVRGCSFMGGGGQYGVYIRCSLMVLRNHSNFTEIRSRLAIKSLSEFLTIIDYCKVADIKK